VDKSRILVPDKAESVDGTGWIEFMNYATLAEKREKQPLS
jgi:hypothetical protein